MDGNIKIEKQCIQVEEACSERKKIRQYFLSAYVLQLHMFIGHSARFISYLSWLGALHKNLFGVLLNKKGYRTH